jgi:hypothetical protein
MESQIEPRDNTWRTLRRWVFRVVTAWAVLCLLAFCQGFILTMAGGPSWLPLPWSDMRSFVECADGTIIVNLAFFSRVVRLDRDGSFLGTSPYPGGASKDTGLAAAADGRVFLRTGTRVSVLDSSWQLLRTYRGNGRYGGNWVLDDAGRPVFAAERAGRRLVVNRLARPGDRIFPRSTSQHSFRCDDGSLLVRKYNHLERYAKDGTRLGSYGAPFVLRPFAFPLPAAMAWPYLFVLGWIAQRRRKRKGEQTETAADARATPE